MFFNATTPKRTTPWRSSLPFRSLPNGGDLTPPNGRLGFVLMIPSFGSFKGKPKSESRGAGVWYLAGAGAFKLSFALQNQTEHRSARHFTGGPNQNIYIYIYIYICLNKYRGSNQTPKIHTKREKQITNTYGSVVRCRSLRSRVPRARLPDLGLRGLQRLIGHRGVGVQEGRRVDLRRALALWRFGGGRASRETWRRGEKRRRLLRAFGNSVLLGVKWGRFLLFCPRKILKPPHPDVKCLAHKALPFRHRKT